MIRKKAILIAVSLFNLVVYAQDPHFSQFYAAPLFTNPAMAGTAECEKGSSIRAISNYRNQWTNMEQGLHTIAASSDGQFFRQRIGFGLMALHDRGGKGTLSTTTFSLIGSFPLETEIVSMRLGIDLQGIQNTLDKRDLVFADQFDPFGNQNVTTGEPGVVNGQLKCNLGTGFLIYTDIFYAGFAVHNLLKPDLRLLPVRQEKIPTRYTLHMGVDLPKERSTSYATNRFAPQALLMVQGEYSQLNVGCNFKWVLGTTRVRDVNQNQLIFGAWVRQTVGLNRNTDALILTAAIKASKFKFGYSYDIVLDGKKTLARYSHEISLAKYWCYGTVAQKTKKRICPAPQ
ncbi:MAG: PorP/SprF family type IX secretion system membrane protein [Bacteroidia bacterium]|nr:PorP/SprF family type IX secretion system membrane protein [Bacteroidia bacterium]